MRQLSGLVASVARRITSFPIAVGRPFEVVPIGFLEKLIKNI